MKHIILSSFILVTFVGCAALNPIARLQPPSFPGTLSNIRFERTPERVTESGKEEFRLVTARFSGCNFRNGMRQLTDLTGVPISWDKSLDNERMQI